MAQLQDLSLFTVSPTYDYHFALSDESHNYGVSAQTLTTINTTRMKTLPVAPNRRAATIGPDQTGTATSRCLLQRMKRMRLYDNPRPSSHTLNLPKRSQRTLQQRRRESSAAPALTIPTTSAYSETQASVAAVQHARQHAPMIWLPEENMWLVADGLQESPTLYGYYGPAPYSEPIPGDHLGSFYREAPPSYTAAIEEPIEYSPVRSQFLHLMESQKNQQAQILVTDTSLEGNQRLRSDSVVSPLFQEAMSGVSFTPSHREPGNAPCPTTLPASGSPRQPLSPAPDRPSSRLASRSPSRSVSRNETRSEALLPGTPPRTASPQLRPSTPPHSRWFNRPDLLRSVESADSMIPEPLFAAGRPPRAVIAST